MRDPVMIEQYPCATGVFGADDIRRLQNVYRAEGDITESANRRGDEVEFGVEDDAFESGK